MLSDLLTVSKKGMNSSSSWSFMSSNHEAQGTWNKAGINTWSFDTWNSKHVFELTRGYNCNTCFLLTAFSG